MAEKILHGTKVADLPLIEHTDDTYIFDFREMVRLGITTDMYAVVQTGVVTAKFAAEVAARGLFYPPDPGSQAVSTIGGNVAENAGGLRGLKYGVTKDYVMGMSLYDVTGELVKTGSRTVKCVTGLNLHGLMVGSEGTLGVFNEIILKLVPPPKAAKALMAVFDDLGKASEAVAAIIAARIVPATLEYMQIRGGFESEGTPFAVRHVAEYLAERLRKG